MGARSLSDFSKSHFDDLSGACVRVREHVPVDLQRDRRRSVADPAADREHFAATIEEMKRRGRLPPGVETDLRPLGHRLNVRPDLPLKRTSARNQPQRRPADIAEESLTRGQLNAVRAALKAGITPARIARQFGISQSNVRKALASHDPKR